MGLVAGGGDAQDAYRGERPTGGEAPAIRGQFPNHTWEAWQETPAAGLR